MVGTTSSVIFSVAKVVVATGSVSVSDSGVVTGFIVWPWDVSVTSIRASCVVSSGRAVVVTCN